MRGAWNRAPPTYNAEARVPNNRNKGEGFKDLYTTRNIRDAIEQTIKKMGMEILISPIQ
tara:strand:+ start:403 stop:579 length:177 start_codon:yes stop_codon:yes gene_type:complete